MKTKKQYKHSGIVFSAYWKKKFVEGFGDLSIFNNPSTIYERVNELKHNLRNFKYVESLDSALSYRDYYNCYKNVFEFSEYVEISIKDATRNVDRLIKSLENNNYNSDLNDDVQIFIELYLFYNSACLFSDHWFCTPYIVFLERIFEAVISDMLKIIPVPIRYEFITYWNGMKRNFSKHEGFSIDAEVANYSLTRLEEMEIDSESGLYEVKILRYMFSLVIEGNAIVTIKKYD